MRVGGGGANQSILLNETRNMYCLNIRKKKRRLYGGKQKSFK